MTTSQVWSEEQARKRLTQEIQKNSIEDHQTKHKTDELGNPGNPDPSAILWFPNGWETGLTWFMLKSIIFSKDFKMFWRYLSADAHVQGKVSIYLFVGMNLVEDWPFYVLSSGGCDITLGCGLWDAQCRGFQLLLVRNGALSSQWEWTAVTLSLAVYGWQLWGT